jgi:hypothetical protein
VSHSPRPMYEKWISYIDVTGHKADELNEMVQYMDRCTPAVQLDVDAARHDA